MSLSIFDDDDLVSALGYSQQLDRKEIARRGGSMRTFRSALLARGAESVHTSDRTWSYIGLVGSTLSHRDVREIVTSPMSATAIAPMYGGRAVLGAIVFFRSLARKSGLRGDTRRDAKRDAYAAITPERRAELTARAAESKAREREQRAARMHAADMRRGQHAPRCFVLTVW